MVFLFNLVWSLFRGKPAGGNPWRATTLEWQTPQTPPAHGNWGKEPRRLPLGLRLQRPRRQEDFIPQNEPAADRLDGIVAAGTCRSGDVSILRQLTEKPWLTPHDLGRRPATEAARMPKAKLGLWVFLSVVTVLFLLLIFAYAGRMTLEDWRPGPELDLLWFNTAALIASSLAMQWAAVAARRGPIADAARGCSPAAC